MGLVSRKSTFDQTGLLLVLILLMEFNSPAKHSDTSTPTRPRTRSVSSRDALRDTRRTLSLASEDEEGQGDVSFDYDSFVDGLTAF